MLAEVERAVVGKRGPLTLVLAAILAQGHVLIEDLPGLGKTLTARSFAQVLGLQFSRAQFTPDLLPADLTGSFLYDQRRGEFEFRPGPVFAGLLLADEVNRTPPKTQSALLEAMQERQVTVEGRTFALPDPFSCSPPPTRWSTRAPTRCPRPSSTGSCCGSGSATPVPRTSTTWSRGGWPDAAGGHRARPGHRRRHGVRALQATVEAVQVDESVGRYCVALAAATRSHGHVQIGASPRGSLGLALAARAFATIRGRDYVVPEDVKAVARSVLGHRISIRPELWMTDATGASVVDEVLTRVPTPATLERR